MTNPHIIFKSIEGKIKAGVVELPEERQTFDNNEACDQMYDMQQALANPIFFKDEKDAIEIRTLLVRQEELKNENWDFELDKPYKIEGVEIEIKEFLNFGFDQYKKYAFIKQHKEQEKEEIVLIPINEEQTIWTNKSGDYVHDITINGSITMEILKSKFTIKRR